MLLSILQAADVGILDACYSTRPARGTNTSVLGVGLLPQFSLLALIAVTLLQYKTPRGKRSKRNDFGPTPTFFAYTFVLAYAWYMGSYLIVTWLKDMLGDSSCSTKVNSVSGHYNFHVYMLATPFLIHSQMVASRMQPSTWWPVRFSYAYFALVVVSMITMAETYYFGYHSLRQIIYGVVFSIFSVAAFDAMRRRYAWFNGFDYAAEPDIFSSLGCVVILQLIGYVLLTFVGGGQFIAGADYLFVVALDAALFVLFLLIPGVRTTTDSNVDIAAREAEAAPSTSSGGARRSGGESKREK